MNKVQNCDIVVLILNLTLRTHVLLVLIDLLAAIFGKARTSHVMEGMNAFRKCPCMNLYVQMSTAENKRKGF